MSVVFNDIPDETYFKLPDSDRIYLKDVLHNVYYNANHNRALAVRTTLTEKIEVVRVAHDQIVNPVYNVMLNIVNSENQIYSIVTDKFGRLHNDNGPAHIQPTGTTRFYYHGILHNLNGPAIIWDSGTLDYFILDEEYPSYLEYLVAVEQFKTKPNKKQEKTLRRIARLC